MCATSRPPEDGKPKNIILIGFMGSGKTCVGEAVAGRLGRELIDTDETIEAEAGRSISDIFADDGEEVFRDFESRAVEAASARVAVVVSVGGGAVLRPENVAALKETGVLFLLDATAEAIYNRVANETHRPLLDVPDPVRTIRDLLEARRPYYAQADVVVDTTGRSVGDIVDELLDRYNEA